MAGAPLVIGRSTVLDTGARAGERPADVDPDEMAVPFIGLPARHRSAFPISPCKPRHEHGCMICVVHRSRCNTRTVRPDCIGIRTSASIQRATDPDRTLGETVKRLKVTLGVMAAVAFAASMQVEGHSGEVGADGCHAGGEPYHCHFRVSKSTRIDPDPPGTPVHKIRKADRKPGRRQVTPEGHSPNAPNRLEGVAKVIDGDTIEIAGNRIRLHGIDALEGRQRCRRADGTTWACGRDATRALRGMIAGGRVGCTVHRRDQYGRAVGTCYANGVDLNGWMVSQGHALAYRRYSRRYVGEEQSARRARKGMHAGEYEPPRSWRRRNPRRRNR